VTTLLWFRRDLRLEDNSALAGALAAGNAVVPVYVFDPAEEGDWPLGGASRWWLHHALVALEAALQARGSRLILAQGPAADLLPALARKVSAGTVRWNRRYEPAAQANEVKVSAALAAAGISSESANSSLLFEPAAIQKRSGGPFQVFSPFWRTCLALEIPEPVTLRRGLWRPVAQWPASRPLRDFALLPTKGWDAGFQPVWEPGEAAAQRRLQSFVRGSIADYAENRNVPGIDGTSRLSPWLHFGELGPRQVWAAVRRPSRDSGVFPAGKGDQTYLNEIGWREFAYHLIHHFPATPRTPLHAEFARFAWAADPGNRQLKAWQRGQTGYPIVDAGMRQLWHTGWMHNRVRMIVASFLVKHLRLPWGRGAEWFWDMLVDADLANNTLNWQWSAGCGADAAPYFRIFAPVLQGKKFDPAGTYVRAWVPELQGLSAADIHAPWEADPASLKGAGVVLGTHYPRPIVDHAQARAAALAALRQLRTVK